MYIYQTVCTDNTQPLTKFYYEKILIFAAFAAMFLVACKGTETPQEQPSLKVNPLALEFAASGNASQTLTVEAVAVEWTHEVSGAAKEWLTVPRPMRKRLP